MNGLTAEELEIVTKFLGFVETFKAENDGRDEDIKYILNSNLLVGENKYDSKTDTYIYEGIRRAEVNTLASIFVKLARNAVNNALPYEVRGIIATSLGLQSNLHIGDFEAMRKMAIENGDEKAIAEIDGMIEAAQNKYRAADKWLHSFPVK